VKEKRGRPKRKSSTSVAVAQPKKTRNNEVEVARDEIEALKLGKYCSILQL
jgi:hypothetical protein